MEGIQGKGTVVQLKRDQWIAIAGCVHSNMWTWREGTASYDVYKWGWGSYGKRGRTMSLNWCRAWRQCSLGILRSRQWVGMCTQKILTVERREAWIVTIKIGIYPLYPRPVYSPSLLSLLRPSRVRLLFPQLWASVPRSSRSPTKGKEGMGNNGKSKDVSFSGIGEKRQKERQ